jgi:hypothetical protein
MSGGAEAGHRLARIKAGSGPGKQHGHGGKMYTLAYIGCVAYAPRWTTPAERRHGTALPRHDRV